jgi:hypothetical protein
MSGSVFVSQGRLPGARSGIAMHAQTEKRNESVALRVECGSEDLVREAAVAVDVDGRVFECTVGPMTKQAVATLDDALYANAPVELVFDSRSLFLHLKSLESSEPRTVRIVGRLTRESSPLH